MIDLSIAVASRSTRALPLACATDPLRGPPLPRIEYHRPVYRFLLRHRGVRRVALGNESPS